MTVVTFNEDIYPYCKGDVVELSADAKKAVDATAKLRGINSPYTKGAKSAEADQSAEAAEEAVVDQLEQDKVNAVVDPNDTQAEVQEKIGK